MSEQVIEKENVLPVVFKDFSLELIKVDRSNFTELVTFTMYKTKENFYKEVRYKYFLNRYFCLALRLIWDYKKPVYVTIDEVNCFLVSENTKFNDFSDFFEKFK